MDGGNGGVVWGRKMGVKKWGGISRVGLEWGC